MTKQNKNLIALGALVVLTTVSYRINVASRSATPAPAPAAVEVKEMAAAKAAQQETPLKARFRKIRLEMDGLYHYRIKPIPFDTKGNPFRIPDGINFSGEKALPVPSGPLALGPLPDNAPPEFGEELLTHAVALTRVGGVVTMNDTTQLTVNSELHKEGDVFTVKIQNKLVLIRIKHLSTTFVTFALDDPASGVAEIRVRLK